MSKKSIIELETERLILRRFSIEDAEAMYNNWASDEDVTKYVTWETHKTVNDSMEILSLWEKEYQQNKLYNWAIVLKNTKKLIGSIGLVIVDEKTAEIGYALSKSYWGNGIMPEAAKRVIKHCFEDLGFSEIRGKHFAKNPKSGRVMQKIGMTYLKTLHNADKDNKGIYQDSICYVLKKKDYKVEK